MCLKEIKILRSLFLNISTISYYILYYFIISPFLQSKRAHWAGINALHKACIQFYITHGSQNITQSNPEQLSRNSPGALLHVALKSNKLKQHTFPLIYSGLNLFYQLYHIACHIKEHNKNILRYGVTPVSALRNRS